LEFTEEVSLLNRKTIDPLTAGNDAAQSITKADVVCATAHKEHTELVGGDPKGRELEAVLERARDPIVIEELCASRDLKVIAAVTAAPQWIVIITGTTYAVTEWSAYLRAHCRRRTTDEREEN
jgi:hypothetical protein